MLREVCDLYEPIAENKDVDLQAEVKHRLNVLGDRDLLFEAVANLVDNAIKFTPEGGRVGIELERGDGKSIVRVADTGPGMPRSRSAMPCCGGSTGRTRSAIQRGVGLPSQSRGRHRQAARLQAGHSSRPRGPNGDHLFRPVVGMKRARSHQAGDAKLGPTRCEPRVPPFHRWR